MLAAGLQSNSAPALPPPLLPSELPLLPRASPSPLVLPSMAARRVPRRRCFPLLSTPQPRLLRLPWRWSPALSGCSAPHRYAPLPPDPAQPRAGARPSPPSPPAQPRTCACVPATPAEPPYLSAEAPLPRFRFISPFYRPPGHPSLEPSNKPPLLPPGYPPLIPPHPSPPRRRTPSTTLWCAWCSSCNPHTVTLCNIM